MPRLPLRTKITYDIHANHVFCSWFYSKLCTPGPPGKTGFSSNVNLNKAIGIPKPYLMESAQHKYVKSLFHSSPAVFQLSCWQSRLCTHLRGTKHEPRKGCTQMSWKGRSLKVCVSQLVLDLLWFCMLPLMQLSKLMVPHWKNSSLGLVLVLADAYSIW